MTTTETTIPPEEVTSEQTPAAKRKPKPKKPAAPSKRGPVKRKATAPKRKPSTTKAKRGPKGRKYVRDGRMAAQGRYVLVINMKPGDQVKLDRAVKVWAKKTGGRASRSSFALAAVYKALGLKTAG